MYKNVGKKIKGYAMTVAWIGIIICSIIGISIMAISEGEPVLILAGILVAVLGSVFCWMTSWLLYGYGELIDTNQKIVKNTKPTFENGIDQDEVTEIKLHILEDVYYNEEIINYDTYVKIKSELTGEAQSRINEYNVSVKFAYDLYQKGAISADTYNSIIKELKRDYEVEK